MKLKSENYNNGKLFCKREYEYKYLPFDLIFGKCSFVLVQQVKAILFSLLLFLLLIIEAKAQKIKLELVYMDKVSDVQHQAPVILQDFSGKDECRIYLKDEFLPKWREKGFLEVSVDSLIENQSTTKAWIHLGPQYTWGRILLDSALESLSTEMNHPLSLKQGGFLTIEKLISVQEFYLSVLEENGYPFAAIKLDSSYFMNNQFFAILKADKGPLYSIDSIHVDGKVKINKNFLVQYLGLGDGSVYQKSKLDLVSKRIAELGFVREAKKWSLSLTGTGAILNLYLVPAQSSRFNFLAGFMPANQQLGGKLLLTGEAEMDLKNVFGGAENIYMNWQQLQVRSPRLQLGFTKPYLFKSNTGIDFNFNLLKKDSSFITLNTRIGLRYEIKPRQIVKLFYQQFTSSLLDVDTSLLKITGRLPAFLDATTSNLGFDFSYQATDNYLNPQRGIQLDLRLLGGIRSIKKNNAITQLKVEGTNLPDFGRLYDSIVLNTSQFRLSAMFNYYLKIGRQSTFKTGLQSGWLLGKQLLINELFQIGGIKTLRGFDEESLFASGYGVGTLEYRYLLSNASFLFAFIDAAYVEQKTKLDDIGKFYGGAGLGITLETKAGMFSLAYAAGKRSAVPINLREAKIHFGFITMF